MRHAIGSYPDTFGERLRDGRCLPGEVGQYINVAQPMTGVGCGAHADRMGWPVDHLGTPVFDWADGDGLTPHIGPVLTAVGGGPVAGVETPFVGPGGEPVTSSYSDGTTASTTNTLVSPAAGQDIRNLILCRPIDDRLALLARVFSTRNAGEGVMIHYRRSDHRLRYSANSTGGTSSATIFISAGYMFIDGYWDFDGDVVLRCNGLLNNVANPGGAHAAWDGIGIGANPAGTLIFPGNMIRSMMWFGGAELDNAADHLNILHHLLGSQNVQGAPQPAFTRASGATKNVGTTYHVLAGSGQRAGSTEGMLVEPARVNKVYNNINPQNANGWLSTGALATTAVNDCAALDASGLLEFGPNAIQCVNATGAPQWVRSGAVTANLNPHSLSVFARIVAGAGPRIGLWDNSLAAFSQDLGAVSDAYVRTMIHGAVPGDTDRVFSMEISDGCTLIFELGQLEESSRCTSPIVNVAAAATATRSMDDLVTTDDPDDGGGSMEITIDPVDWSAAEAGIAPMVYLSGSGLPAIWVEGGTWRARIDGTWLLDSGIAPADGVAHRIRLRWTYAGQQSIEVWNGTTLLARVASLYDGTLYSAGTWEVATGASVLVTGLLTYRNGGG